MKALIFYKNTAAQKKEIYKNNNNKIGIYMWTHNSTGSKYVGSSINLSQRFVKYFSIPSLKSEIIRNKSRIYRAILKYGMDDFTLEIMEYCDSNVLTEREQFYLDSIKPIKPIYNILSIAGSRGGFKHSEETKELQRVFKLGYKVSNTTKLKMSIANTKAKSVTVKNILTEEIFEFISVRKAAQFFKSSHSQIIIYIKNGKPFRNVYKIYYKKK
ncbi:uncharacterized protein MYCFIDRAFT_128635 [Pseudocercospora fijiensis CIRAD86]|uniref:GIY-YIG domain-containing protein n=1 Tax=Pseudocercospora fijiensis (strain CIRAD86) TaxID=383855 RepID=N1Q9W8_PSEFD|nr:uncharacterized protein MYCFIDRAFT_128635 [Pseudocercospora fijiensis CIRAD86]EME87692.1 hypothetical protein MYCFIDRAFT_128635 [Pseudocercospora fijiensis CIRAD86]